MDYQDLRRTILGVPQLADWPEIAERFKPDEGLPSQDWRLPVAACQAVGGAEAACLAAGGAVTCLQMSILIIDDLLDEDPRGAHHEIGVGAAANIAAALESAAVEIICRSGVDASIVAAAAHVLSETALQTALGQRMDVLNRGGEDGLLDSHPCQELTLLQGMFRAGCNHGPGRCLLPSRPWPKSGCSLARVSNFTMISWTRWRCRLSPTGSALRTIC